MWAEKQTIAQTPEDPFLITTSSPPSEVPIILTFVIIIFLHFFIVLPTMYANKTLNIYFYLPPIQLSIKGITLCAFFYIFH